MKTGFEAMRLGSVIYFIPFFFVLEPALVLQGTASEIVTSTLLALGGIALFAWSLQGYIPLVGPLFGGRLYGLPLRIVLLCAAILIALPQEGVPGWSDIELLLAALAIALPVVALAYFQNRAASGHSAVA